MSEQRHDELSARPPPTSIDELARAQHAETVSDAEELTADIWESDEELDAFLADLRACRDSSPA